MKNIRESPSPKSICCLLMEKAILNVERYQNLIEIRNKISYRMDLYVQEIEVQV